MGSVGLWQVTFVLVYLGVPLLGVELSKRSKNVSRKAYLIWILGLVVMVGLMVTMPVPELRIVLVVAYFIFLIIFYQKTAARFRDAGKSVWLTAWACVPLANFFVVLGAAVLPTRVDSEPPR